MAKSKKASSWLLLIVFRVLTFGFIVAGGVMTYYSWDFDQNARYATGVVVDLEVDYSSDSTTYKPVFEFADFLGETHRASSFLSSSSYDYSRGEKVSILYDYRDPTNIRINNWLELWGFGVIFLVAGAIPFVVLTIVARKRKKNRPPKVEKRQLHREYTHLESPETPEDHARETNYTPTVRRIR